MELPALGMRKMFKCKDRVDSKKEIEVMKVAIKFSLDMMSGATDFDGNRVRHPLISLFRRDLKYFRIMKICQTCNLCLLICCTQRFHLAPISDSISTTKCPKGNRPRTVQAFSLHIWNIPITLLGPMELRKFCFLLNRSIMFYALLPFTTKNSYRNPSPIQKINNIPNKLSIFHKYRVVTKSEIWWKVRVKIDVPIAKENIVT